MERVSGAAPQGVAADAGNMGRVEELRERIRQLEARIETFRGGE
jgi:hypothetical protein